MMFFSLLKGGIGVGVLITHDIHRNKWNAPCGISISYVSKLIDVRLHKINYLVLMNNDRRNIEKIMSFPTKEFFQLGGNIPISVRNQSNNNNIDEFKENGLSLYFLTEEVTDFMKFTLEGTLITLHKKKIINTIIKKISMKWIF